MKTLFTIIILLSIGCSSTTRLVSEKENTWISVNDGTAFAALYFCEANRVLEPKSDEIKHADPKCYETRYLNHQSR